MNTSGTGLGLSICKTIIEKIGGTVGVTSTKGVGSTFTINVKAKCKTHHSFDEDEILDESQSVSLSSQNWNFDSRPFVFLETNE